jgi:threonylcarbamoyladenosine tRNA methylthiotransferase MtaB
VPQELALIAGVVVSNRDKEYLLDIVEGLSLQASPDGIASRSPDSERSEEERAAKQSHIALGIGGGQAPALQYGTARVRSLMKIQDGCHSPCAYCIVPHVRDCEYSVPASQIIKEVKDKVAIGYREVVLTGTKIGCYREDSAGLGNLVERILCDTEIERLRLSSLQPQEISPKLLSLWQDARLCRHFHLALQSGSDAVLQRMRRRYSLSDYQGVISLIAEMIPGVAVTTDVMVGFPGESDEEFEQGYLFCQQVGFANIHVFPYSVRPGTAAARMPNQVNDRLKKERSHRMLELARQCRHSFCEQFIGQIMPVLWEKETELGSGIYSGLTDNYIRVFTRSREPLTNKIVPVKLTGFHNQGMWGELVGENSS